MSDARYNTTRWRRRRRLQLEAEPLCVFCLRRGLTRAATVADHVTPHRGDEALFWEGLLQSLCKRCHDKAKQLEEIHGYSLELDVSGWPIDPRHTANRQDNG